MFGTKDQLQSQQVRQQLLEAIGILCDQAGQNEDAIQRLTVLETTFQEKLGIFSIDSLVFGNFVSVALDFRSESNVLSQLQNELMGIEPYWATYALKHNFAELLCDDALLAYRQLIQLFDDLTCRVDHDRANTSQNGVDNDETLRDSLYDLCYNRLQTETVGELLVSLASHILLSLPDDGSRHFDVTETFGSILPVPTTEPIRPQLDYITHILQQIEGNSVVYIDIHFSPSGFLLNVR